MTKNILDPSINDFIIYATYVTRITFPGFEDRTHILIIDIPEFGIKIWDESISDPYKVYNSPKVCFQFQTNPYPELLFFPALSNIMYKISDCHSLPEPLTEMANKLKALCKKNQA